MLDVLKFGFTLKSKIENLTFYEKIISDTRLEIMECSGIYSLSLYYKDFNEMVLASRYKCNTQQQLDFIILNGRAASLFMEFKPI